MHGQWPAGVPTLSTVKESPRIDPDTFIRAVQPLLARQDVNGLCSLIKTRWSC